ncbi:LAQU0S22e01046g1_1 [Lachancea quebecensis]|uniref:LAQU0S22e01046g1_1 n=1 Tax=Lachancea quebecensis TaxID=1654605 RepID=A0A0P1KYA3_9SACH|nr:LAQU0S22e01046g1_1 [Lachancea quebecensis]
MNKKVYAEIHQRCAVTDIIHTVSVIESIDTREFIEQLELVISRNPYYAKRLIKALTDNIELIETGGGHGSKEMPWKCGGYEVDLGEWLYERYVDLLPLKAPVPTFTDIIRYTLNDELAIDIQEQPFLLCAAGTTGFRTWESALYLSKYLAKNFSEFSAGKFSRVLELGAGTGLVSITWAKLFKNFTRDLVVTDGDSSLVEQATRFNFQLNGIDTSESHASCNYKFQRLWWGEDAVPEVDIVLAADVTYDSSVIPSLINCLKTALSQGARFALVAATVRNKRTTMAFERECKDHDMSWKIISCKNGSLAPICIYKVHIEAAGGKAKPINH